MSLLRPYLPLLLGVVGNIMASTEPNLQAFFAAHPMVYQVGVTVALVLSSYARSPKDHTN